MAGRLRLPVDGFTLALVGAMALGALAPAWGSGAQILATVTQAAIAVLFFMHGAKLPTEAIVDGLRAWRLHVLVLAFTFVVFPVLGLCAGLAAPSLISPTVAAGVLFLCLLPSTVQSSIAFTSIAGGDVAAAVCAAALSNVVGVLLTPVLAGWLMAVEGSVPMLDGVRNIALQLLAPFVAGHLARRWIGRWIDARKATLIHIDRAAILLVVYKAFSAATMSNLWDDLSLTDVIAIAVLSAGLLAIVIPLATSAARAFGFSRAEEIAIVFCSSKKSLASGAPMAAVLFAGPQAGVIILPLMLFHQLQLTVCAILAQRYAAGRPERKASSTRSTES